MGYLSFDIVDLTLPYACLGSMPSRLLFGALWPFAVTSALVIGIAVHALVMHIAAGAAAPSRSEALRTVASRCLYALVFVCYLELPSVSRSIFTAQHCESYAFDDATGQTISFLTADLSMHCNTGPGWTNEAQRLAAYFWSFFVLWPVLVPLGFLALLLQVRAAVRAQRVSSIARSSAFLWRDYDSAHLYWECVDLWRKVCRAQYLSSLSSAVTPPLPVASQIFLTAVMLFIEREDGSNKLLRLIVAITVTVFYLAILATVRPFKHADDAAFACLANMLLACSFAFGIVLKLCEEGQGERTCERYIGLRSSYSASVFVVGFSAAMIAAFCLVTVAKAAAAVATPTLKMAASGRPPALDLPKKLHFHLFLSHVWSTGQDQALDPTELALASCSHPVPPLLDPHAGQPAAASAAGCPHLAGRREPRGHQQTGGVRGRGSRHRHRFVQGLLCERQLQAARQQ